MYLLTHCSPVHWIDHGVICWMQDTMTLLMHRGNSMSRASSALFAMPHASEKRRAKRQKVVHVSLNWILRPPPVPAKVYKDYAYNKQGMLYQCDHLRSRSSLTKQWRHSCLLLSHLTLLASPTLITVCVAVRCLMPDQPHGRAHFQFRASRHA